MEQSKPKEAVDIALEAYRLYPQDDEVIEMAAEALLSDGKYAAAERILSFLPQAIKPFPCSTPRPLRSARCGYPSLLR